MADAKRSAAASAKKSRGTMKRKVRAKAPKVARRKLGRRVNLAAPRRHGGSYGARITKTPLADLRRGWTGAQGILAATPTQAIIDYVYAEGHGRSVLADMEEEWEQQIEKQRDEAEYYGRQFHAPKSMEDDEDFVREYARREGLVVRYLPSAGKYAIHDHDGLAVWLVREGNTEPDTDAAAFKIAKAKEAQYRRDFDLYEGGYATVGKVRYVGRIKGDLHLFWAEKMVTEESVRD